MWVVKLEELTKYIKDYSLIGCSSYSQKEQDEHILNWVSENCFKIEENNKQDNQNEDEFYKPMCPYGYADCIYDCNYIKTVYPEWYKELGEPTECEDCVEGNMYDDEDK